MFKRVDLLDAAEYSTFLGCILGVISTTITKQILYTFAPLACTFFLNFINLQKYKNQSIRSLEKSQELLSLYQSQESKINKIYQEQEKSIQKLYHQQNAQICDLLETESQQNNDLLEALMTFTEEYKYQKLELEALIQEAINKKDELNKIVNESSNVSNFKSILIKLNNVELSNSELEKRLKNNLLVIEDRLIKLEEDFPKTQARPYSNIGESKALVGLTQYYLLPGLCQRLIKEAKDSDDIKCFQETNYHEILTENTLKYVQKAAKRSQYLAEKVISHHNDHGCSRQEAECLSAELNQLSIELSMVRSTFDLRIMYKVAILFTHQISRFQHKESKYRWNRLMREEISNVLNDCFLQSNSSV